MSGRALYRVGWVLLCPLAVSLAVASLVLWGWGVGHVEDGGTYVSGAAFGLGVLGWISAWAGHTVRRRARCRLLARGVGRVGREG